MDCNEIVNANCLHCEKAVDCYSWRYYCYVFEKELYEEFMLKYAEEDYAERYMD